MGTLRGSGSPGQRVKAGDTVLDRAKAAPVKPVKKRLDAFRKEHVLYKKAHQVCADAHGDVIAQERALGEADDAHDEAVEALAQARIGAGAHRLRPFADLKAATVSEIQAMPAEKQVKVVLALVAKLVKSADAKVKKAATQARDAALAVQREAKPLAALRSKRDAAMSARDAIGPRWEKTFAALKRGVRAAEDEGSAGLHAALFEVEARPRKPKRATPPAT